MFKITVVALGNKMPSWVNEATTEFNKRLQEFALVNWIEIPLIKRGKNTDLARIIEKESALMSEAIPSSAQVIALTIDGKTFSSENLAEKILAIQHISSHLCLLIGGPEGLSDTVLMRCQERWSLSKLTLPHPLVRIVLLEAIYRAFTINNNHPYHK